MAGSRLDLVDACHQLDGRPDFILKNSQSNIPASLHCKFARDMHNERRAIFFAPLVLDSLSEIPTARSMSTHRHKKVKSHHRGSFRPSSEQVL